MHARCLCGGVHVEITGKLGPVVYCHCSRCRKASGTAFAANADVRRKYWTFVAGESLVREFESSPGVFRAFCSRCGSPIYSRRVRDPEVLRLRLGMLDDDPERRSLAHLGLGAAFLIAFNRLATVFDERAWQLGVMRATGLRAGTLWWELLKESLILGALGVALGIPLGIGLGAPSPPSDCHHDGHELEASRPGCDLGSPRMARGAGERRRDDSGPRYRPDTRRQQGNVGRPRPRTGDDSCNDGDASERRITRLGPRGNVRCSRDRRARRATICSGTKPSGASSCHRAHSVRTLRCHRTLSQAPPHRTDGRYARRRLWNRDLDLDYRAKLRKVGHRCSYGCTSWRHRRQFSPS